MGRNQYSAITDLKRKLLFMDSTVKAASMYGVEIWGWKRSDRENPEQIYKSEYGTRKKHPWLDMENEGRKEEFRNRVKNKIDGQVSV